MPEISVRGLEMPESPIRKLAPLAAAAKNRGIKVYHLNIGQPDLPTPQCGLDALKTVDRKVLEYSPSQGNLTYRQKLVNYYKKYDINVTADDIIITSGGSEAVLFAFMSCLNPGDEIIVPEPAYANYMAFAISAGAKIRTIATTIEEGFSLPKVEKFEELINEHEIMQRAYAQANELIEQATAQAQAILDNATEEANSIRYGAMQYTDDMLAKLQYIIEHSIKDNKEKYDSLLSGLENVLSVVNNNRNELSGIEEGETEETVQNNSEDSDSTDTDNNE